MNNAESMLKLITAEPQTPSDDEVAQRRRSYWENTLRIECEDAEGVRFTGSGVLLTSTGLFLTNHHVLKDNYHNTVLRFQGSFSNYEMQSAVLESRLQISEEYDLVLGKCSIPLNIQEELHRYMHPPVFSHANPDQEDLVHVFGFKYGRVDELQGKLLGRNGERRRTAANRHTMDSTLLHANTPAKDVWFTNALVEKGFSGGPVISATSGELIGITSAMVIDDAHPESQPDHLYVSINGVRHVIAEYLRKQGHTIVETKVSDAAPTQYALVLRSDPANYALMQSSR